MRRGRKWTNIHVDTHAEAGCGAQTVTEASGPYRVISVQLGAVAEDLVGEAVQVVDVVGEPRHWRIITVIKP